MSPPVRRSLSVVMVAAFASLGAMPLATAGPVPWCPTLDHCTPAVARAVALGLCGNTIIEFEARGADDDTLPTTCRFVFNYYLGDGPGNVGEPPDGNLNPSNEGCVPGLDHLALSGESPTPGTYRFSVTVRVCHAWSADHPAGQPNITTSDGYRPTWVQQGLDHFYVYNQDHKTRDVTFCIRLLSGKVLCRSWHQYN